jgi:hypothetical protein
MGTKAHELSLMALGQGCLGKAGMDEPLFILRAQDDSAPSMVRYWIARQIANGTPYDSPKLAEALSCAEAMERWQLKFGSKRAD